jgi:hypothetical protein
MLALCLCGELPATQQQREMKCSPVLKQKGSRYQRLP